MSIIISMSLERTNKDQLHEIWLDDYVRFATQYLGAKHELKPPERAILFVDHADNNLFEFEALHEFALPAGSGTLALFHARFSQVILPYHEPDRILNTHSMKRFPRTTFCLSSLLSASFPRNPKTQIFKRTIAGTMVLSLSEDAIAERPESVLSHVAFAGLGTMLMKRTRELLFPLATDQETIDKADGYYISMIEGS